MTSSRTKFWYSLTAVFVSVFTAMIMCIIYANHVGAASQRAAQSAIHSEAPGARCPRANDVRCHEGPRSPEN